jgi:hypothetical protein
MIMNGLNRFTKLTSTVSDRENDWFRVVATTVGPDGQSSGAADVTPLDPHFPEFSFLTNHENHSHFHFLPR